MKLLWKLAKWYLIADVATICAVFTGISLDHVFEREDDGKVWQKNTIFESHEECFSDAASGFRKWWDALNNK